MRGEFRGVPLTIRPAPGALDALLKAVDRDDDQRITVLDGDHPRFDLPLADGSTFPVTGTYPLANLVQELTLLRDQSDGEHAVIEVARLTENPVDRLSRLIRDTYWTGLTRRLGGDDRELARVLADDKMEAGQVRYLYVAHDDEEEYAYYSRQARRLPWLEVRRLPESVTPEWVSHLLPEEHGMLGLAIQGSRPVPYVVPGGRFNELYGWDSYFHVLGLLQDGHARLARAIVENLAYEVHHYGQILNANRTYYLTRSQPPLLSSMVVAVWQDQPAQLDEAWLQRMVETVIDEYRTVWTQGTRLTNICRQGICLSRYFGAGIGAPPEVEPGHFDWLYRQRASKADMTAQQYEQRYRARDLPTEQLQALDTFFTHDRCMRESGHDTTYRWFDPQRGEDRCADFATVDLNSLLLKYELDIARLTAALGGAFQRTRCETGDCVETKESWCNRASRRLDVIRSEMWDEERHLFFDVDVSTGRRSQYISATSVYPLWALGDNVCELQLFAGDEEPVAHLVASLLRHLEQPGGLASTARASAEPPRQTLAGALGQPEGELMRQWDYPNGWAPHQILTWTALRQHGFDREANRLTWRWLGMLLENVRDYHGTVPEKYDVVRRTHLVFAEYGNVGTEFAYITKEGFGWMNASFQLGLAALPLELRAQLRRAAADLSTDIPHEP